MTKCNYYHDYDNPQYHKNNNYCNDNLEKECNCEDCFDCKTLGCPCAQLQQDQCDQGQKQNQGQTQDQRPLVQRLAI